MSSASGERLSGETGHDGVGLRLLDNVYLVSWLGMTPGNIDCSVYVLRGSSGLVMIDGGTPWGHDRLCRHAQHWGLDLDQVQTIFITHGHVDHARGGYLFKRRGVEVLGHAIAAGLAESEWRECLAAERSDESYRFDAHLGGGERVSRAGLEIEVLHTPGHTGGCLSYLVEIDGARCLFSGDLIMGCGRPGYRGDATYSEAAIVSSLERLREVEFDHLFYGHGQLLNDHGRLFRSALEKAGNGGWAVDA